VSKDSDITPGASHRLPSRLAAQIVERMRQMGWPTGVHLREQELADTFRVSRTPVRMALLTLQQMNLVENRPNRGFFLMEQHGTAKQGDAVSGPTNEDPLYFAVAEDRLRGALGSRCTEAELARRYNVSRARILRLLAQMAQEGLVLRLPGNGWEFLPLLTSPEAYDQGYRYRMLIEPAALMEPKYTLSPATMSELRIKQQAMLNGGIHAWSRSETFGANSDFHEVIVSGASNPFLLEGLKRVNRSRRLLEYRTHQFRDRLVGECRDHFHLLDLIEGGEISEAAVFLYEHLDRARVAKAKILTDGIPVATRRRAPSRRAQAGKTDAAAS
jgi:DNA-binding GntR family transcriptional regulator